MKAFKYTWYSLLMMSSCLPLCCNTASSTPSCNQIAYKANEQMLMFTLDNQLTHLDSALSILSTVLADCEGDNLKRLKLRALLMADRHDESLAYLLSLKPEDFNRPYRKDAYRYYILAEQMGDLQHYSERDSLYGLAVSSIENFLRKNGPDSEAMIDKVLLEKSFVSESVLLDNISLLSSEDYDDTLKNTLKALVTFEYYLF